jgi:hypothetical protein
MSHLAGCEQNAHKYNYLFAHSRSQNNRNARASHRMRFDDDPESKYEHATIDRSIDRGQRAISWAGDDGDALGGTRRAHRQAARRRSASLYPPRRHTLCRLFFWICFPLIFAVCCRRRIKFCVCFVCRGCVRAFRFAAALAFDPFGWLVRMLCLWPTCDDANPAYIDRTTWKVCFIIVLSRENVFNFVGVSFAIATDSNRLRCRCATSISLNRCLLFVIRRFAHRRDRTQLMTTTIATGDLALRDRRSTRGAQATPSAALRRRSSSIVARFVCLVADCFLLLFFGISSTDDDDDRSTAANATAVDVAAWRLAGTRYDDDYFQRMFFFFFFFFFVSTNA